MYGLINPIIRSQTKSLLLEPKISGEEIAMNITEKKTQGSVDNNNHKESKGKSKTDSIRNNYTQNNQSTEESVRNVYLNNRMR